MALQYKIKPRPDAGTVQLLSWDYNDETETSSGKLYFFGTFYGWKDITVHPLWRFVRAEWTWKDTFTNFDGEVIVSTHEVADSRIELDPSAMQREYFNDGYLVETVESLGTSFHHYEVLDLAFVFEHSQSGKIIRTPAGKIMRSAGGIVLRDN